MRNGHDKNEQSQRQQHNSDKEKTFHNRLRSRID
jgi:hypothetical protein